MRYALHIVLNEPVDFTAHDIPVIRRWWCLLLMENFALGGHGRWLAHWAEEAMAVGSCLTDSEPMNGPGEIEYGVGALEGVTPPHNLENANMMSSIRKGVEWLKENHQLMKSKYLPPRIDCMEEEDALKALARLHTHCDTTLDEDDEIRAPFYFTFKNREDMLLFMSEVRDNKNVSTKEDTGNSVLGFKGFGTSVKVSTKEDMGNSVLGFKEKFRDYLYYAPTFTVFSDNNPLTYVLTSAKLNATRCRWVSELADFHFTICYRPGRENIDADSLSRMPVDLETTMRECTEEFSSDCVGLMRL
ncbi:uncharacterized protein LOC127658287 [Xyrauchen texanus]|uniref:uncharacterized protein LOC127658287 n=1 Tax=Xyrauchen texanus TaxID=154827 RepID=UPI0022423312|nr:uncharacterized protein LOC127658287 [Xyrauchen texanus]